MRVNIQVTRALSCDGRGGFDVAMTVIDSHIKEAVFGITRTILQRPSTAGSGGSDSLLPGP